MWKRPKSNMPLLKILVNIRILLLWPFLKIFNTVLFSCLKTNKPKKKFRKKLREKNRCIVIKEMNRGNQIIKGSCYDI